MFAYGNPRRGCLSVAYGDRVTETPPVGVAHQHVTVCTTDSVNPLSGIFEHTGTPTATDIYPLTGMRTDTQQRPANAPFRLVTLHNRKQPAFPKPTSPTLTRRLDRPNGNWEPQEQEETATTQPARAVITEKPATRKNTQTRPANAPFRLAALL